MSEGPFDAALRERHIAESMERMPGPTYYDVLGWIHETVRPANYLEIGVRHGFSLGNVLEETRTVAVDPEPLVTYPFPNLEIFGITSDEFFERDDVDEILRGPIELAFIDGLHLFEQVIRDFINVERHSDPDTIALFHDPLPLNEVTAARERTTEFYSGDVWKAVLAIRRVRPDLEMVTVPAAPTGLTIARGLDRDDGTLAAEFDAIVAEYMDLGIDYLDDHRDDMPAQIPNDEDAVRDWLRPYS